MNREELIQICLDSVVKHDKWSDRDSYCAQKNIEHIYKCLMVGAGFYITSISDDSISLNFDPLTGKQKEKISDYSLDIDSREDYIEWFNSHYDTGFSDDDMFDCKSMNYYDNNEYLGGYLPTSERLNITNGEDWY